MTHPLAPALILTAAVAAAAEPPDDLLRFSNGDQLHGRFAGLAERGRIAWQRPDLTETIELEPDKARQIVLRGGRPARGIDAVASVRMVGGDRLPCTITGLDERNLVIETPYAGRLTIPRDRVDTLAPQPFGGTLRYAGPFDEQGWRILAAPDQEDAGEPPKQAGDKPRQSPPWVFSRTAWYSSEDATIQPLVRDDAMGDTALIRFHLAWRNSSQVGLSIAFHADFAPPPAAAGADADEDQRAQVRRGTLALPYQFGNAYVLAINPHYSMMYRCGFDEQGKPFTVRMENTSNGSQLPQDGEADIELRSDRRERRILLFIDGEFRMQWDESDGPWAGKGAGFGFLASGGGQFRISDLLVADWNGMRDSARSMEAPDRDVILLSNGTDRFSGRVRSVQDEQVVVEGSYATMRIPLAQVAEIHFARQSLAATPEPPAGQWIVHLHPLGRIAGTPRRTEAGRLTLDSPHLGEVPVALDFATMLDLQPANSFVDDWDLPF